MSNYTRTYNGPVREYEVHKHFSIEKGLFEFNFIITGKTWKDLVRLLYRTL